jgi:hypothetical protein
MHQPGSIGGAIFGAILAIIASAGYDEASEGESPISSLGVGDYIALGISMLTLARQFGGLLKRV